MVPWVVGVVLRVKEKLLGKAFWGWGWDFEFLNS
jgi:hypothetical protein